jgi:hypothetical protein
MRRKDNHNLVIRLEGYEPFEMTLTRQSSGWVFGNILFCWGAPIGIVIDAIAGGMYTLKPEQVEAQLRPTAAKVVLGEDSLLVFLVPEVDPEWRKIGQLQPN